MSVVEKAFHDYEVRYVPRAEQHVAQQKRRDRPEAHVEGPPLQSAAVRA